jgi:hypothetical protein
MAATDNSCFRLVDSKFHIIWPSGFKGKAVLEIDQSETRIAYDGHVC